MKMMMMIMIRMQDQQHKESNNEYVIIFDIQDTLIQTPAQKLRSGPNHYSQ